MKSSKVRHRSVERTDAAGVYASLDDLIRLQYKARGFGFLPRLYGHLESWFDKTWKAGDFELVE